MQNEVERSLCTIREMFEARGWPTDGVLDAGSPAVLEAVASARDDVPVFVLDVPARGGTRIVYNLYPKFKVAEVKRAFQGGGSSAFRHVLFVTREKPSSLAGLDALLSSSSSSTSQASHEFFRLVELQVNISKHRLVPKHEPVTDEAEIVKIMAAYRLRSRYHLPIIHSNDAMARFLGLQPGQLVRISRQSPSAGTYVLFRCCQKSG